MASLPVCLSNKLAIIGLKFSKWHVTFPELDERHAGGLGFVLCQSRLSTLGLVMRNIERR